MKRIKKTALCLVAIMVVAACAQGCNTIRGVGKDVERGGTAIQDAATK